MTTNLLDIVLDVIAPALGLMPSAKFNGYEKRLVSGEVIYYADSLPALCFAILDELERRGHDWGAGCVRGRGGHYCMIYEDVEELSVVVECQPTKEAAIINAAAQYVATLDKTEQDNENK